MSKPGWGVRVGMAALRGVFREVRKIREAVEVGVDSYRWQVGLPPRFVPDVEVGREIAGPISAEETGGGDPLPPSDYGLYDAVERLARLHRVPYSLDQDLVALGIDRGWISPEGELLVMPPEE